MDMLLKRSLEDNIKIVIIYQKDDEFTKRIIKVKEIREDSIKAYCYYKKGVRYFKLDNILATELYHGD